LSGCWRDCRWRCCIGYGVTIPASAEHPDEAAQFIAFLLSDEGHSLMEADHHPMFETFTADKYENLPSVLQAVTTK
jgi:ABC-type Fe3+ transport system substrate-binding protein